MRLRIRGRKDRIIHSLKDIGFTIVAMGDGYNDEFMFRVADYPVLFRAPDDLAERIPNGTRVTLADVARVLGLESVREALLAAKSGAQAWEALQAAEAAR